MIKIIELMGDDQSHIHDNSQYYLLAPFKFNSNIVIYKYMKRLNMKPDSFSYNYCKRILSAILSTRKNLNQVYQEYYNEEYDNFECFLFNKLLWNIDQINYVMRNLDNNECIYSFSVSLVSYNLSTFLEHEPRVLKNINKLLGEIL